MSETSDVTRWRKKPVEVDAVQWTGGNYDEIAEFTGRGGFVVLSAEDRANSDDPDCSASVFDKLHSTWVLVKDGQWIIRGVKGEFYPCDDGVFRETYEPADGPASPSTAERDLIRDDLGQLLELLGLGDYARPESPHEVFQQCLTEVRRVTTDRNDLSHLNTSQASRIRELGASLSSLTDRAEAGRVITGDEADEYRSLIAAPVPVPDDEDDESPGYWQVRAVLSSALNALQLVALSPYGDIAAMAKDVLAKADAALEGEPERDERAEAKLLAIAELCQARINGYLAGDPGGMGARYPDDVQVSAADILAIISTGETPGTTSEEENNG